LTPAGEIAAAPAREASAVGGGEPSDVAEDRAEGDRHFGLGLRHTPEKSREAAPVFVGEVVQ
jgi:hypothetical protein